MSFPKYPKYKDSGVEWLGVVPEHWDVTPLKSIATCNDEVLDEKTEPSLEILYIDISSVNLNEGITQKEQLLFENSPSRARRRVRHGDVIVSTVRTYLKSIARIRDPEPNLIVSTGFAVVRPTNSLASGFLGHLLTTSYFIEEVIARSSGVSYPAINASELVSIPVPLPPLPEQRAIASFLDRETAKIDALVAEQQRLIELLQEKRQAVISHAVTKGLNPHARMKDSGIEWLGEVPEHWEVVLLKRIATVNTGVAKGKDLAGQQTINVPYLRVANVQDGYVSLDEVTTIDIQPHELDRYRLHTGDVLMNEGGDYDKLGRGCVWESQIEPCITQNHVFAVRPHSVDPWWLNSITSSEYAQFYFMSHSKQSTNLASISSTNLMNLPVVLPGTVEQQEILSFVRCAVQKFDSLITQAQRAIDLLQERRTALISAAVTGKIDVRHLAQTKVSA